MRNVVYRPLKLDLKQYKLAQIDEMKNLSHLHNEYSYLHPSNKHQADTTESGYPNLTESQQEKCYQLKSVTMWYIHK